MGALIFSLVIVMSIAIICYTIYKKDELEYKKHENEYTEKTISGRTQLEIEQEKTKQELERTKQLEIKTNYRKETGHSLY